jgi:hypothetical protein
MAVLGGESGGERRIIIVDLPCDLWHESALGFAEKINNGTSNTISIQCVMI